jgi:hypothetical protein
MSCGLESSPAEISHPISLGQQPGHLADHSGLARYAVQAFTAPQEHEQPRLTRSRGSFRCRTTRRETGSERGEQDAEHPCGLPSLGAGGSEHVGGGLAEVGQTRPADQRVELQPEVPGWTE